MPDLTHRPSPRNQLQTTDSLKIFVRVVRPRCPRAVNLIPEPVNASETLLGIN